MNYNCFMLLNDEKRFSKFDRLGRKWHRRVLTLRCDECMHEFEYVGVNVNDRATQRHHFCSHDCAAKSQNDGELRATIEATCLERYGTSSPLGSKSCQAKSRETCMSKYGVHHTGAAPTLVAKRQQTCVERYGSKSVLATARVREILRSDEVREKVYQTLKRNNSYCKSKPEDRLYEVLCEIFGVDDVERQAIVNDRWAIDFYVKSINTYVQYDSYWHGVGRTLDEVAQFKTKRDVVIHKKMLTDIAQKVFFEERNMKLVRIQSLVPSQMTRSVITTTLL